MRWKASTAITSGRQKAKSPNHAKQNAKKTSARSRGYPGKSATHLLGEHEGARLLGGAADDAELVEHEEEEERADADDRAPPRGSARQQKRHAWCAGAAAAALRRLVLVHSFLGARLQPEHRPPQLAHRSPGSTGKKTAPLRTGWCRKEYHKMLGSSMYLIWQSWCFQHEEGALSHYECIEYRGAERIFRETSREIPG